MKKLLSMVIISTLAILVVFTLNASDIDAQGKGKAQKPQTKTIADADGDGIPNNLDKDFVRGSAQGRGSQRNFIDENGDGISDFIQNNTRQSGNFGRNIRNMNFVDANGDGICDNVGTGQGLGLRNGQGGGMNFIDQNGDGVCDRFQAGTTAGKNFKKGLRRSGRKK